MEEVDVATTKVEAKSLVEKAVEDERETINVATKKEIVEEETIEQRVADEVVAKVVEEEKRKIYKEDMNNDASPMETNLPESSM